jgi:hypothetical protein
VPFTVEPILAVSTHIVATKGDTICLGNSDTYIATSVNGGTSPVYSWLVNGSVVSGVTGNTYTYIPANGDVIKCILTSNAACAIPNTATSNTITMLVNPLTHPTVTMFPPSTDTLCVGTVQSYSVTFTQGGTAPAFVWTVNWIPVASGTTNYTYTPNNGDIIRCGMISSSPCPVPDTAFGIDTMVVKGYDTPKVAIVGLTGMSACQGNMTTLTANTTYGGWGPTYYWTVNGMTVTGNGGQYSYYPADSDKVSVTLISNYPCPIPTDTATDMVTVVVDPIIIVTITDSYGGLVTIAASDTLVAHVLNGGTDPTYQWYKNGIIIPGATAFELIENDFKDKDSVSCDVTTGSGSACEGVIGHNWIILEVAPTGVATIGAAISDIKLTPNPNTGIFMVEGTIAVNNKDVTLQITNVIGQQVYNETVPVTGNKLHSRVSMDAGLANGIYILHVITDAGSSVVRFSVER